MWERPAKMHDPAVQGRTAKAGPAPSACLWQASPYGPAALSRPHLHLHLLPGIAPEVQAPHVIEEHPTSAGLLGVPATNEP